MHELANCEDYVEVQWIVQDQIIYVKLQQIYFKIQEALFDTDNHIFTFLKLNINLYTMPRETNILLIQAKNVRQSQKENTINLYDVVKWCPRGV